MNDFDFEELDKAVNELATKTHEEHGGPDPATAQAAAPVSVAPADKPASTPPPVTEPPAKPVEVTRPAPIVEPPRHTRLSDTRPRSRGAFMDIVTPPARKPGGHIGVSIQPISKLEDVVPQKPQESPIESQAKPVADKPPKAVESPLPPAAPGKSAEDVAWPDPLDFRDGGAPGDKKETKDSAPTETASPFLAEAKVEKRPLGAFSHFRAKSDDKPAEAQPEIQDELTPEASGEFKEPKPTEPGTEKAPTAASARAEEPAEPAKPDVHGAAMMSIPEQYHAPAKGVDKRVRPVFDAKEYHPPLLEATSERRGSGVLMKLFIALIVLALLGAAGYFVYVYVAQHS